MIDARGATPRTASPARRVIALTLDDGPDPIWTPKILAVLREQHVPATFFLIGTQAIAHPDIVRQAVADDGNEIGVHTLTHADLGTLGWWQNLELSDAQLDVEGA